MLGYSAFDLIGRSNSRHRKVCIGPVINIIKKDQNILLHSYAFEQQDFFIELFGFEPLTEFLFSAQLAAALPTSGD